MKALTIAIAIALSIAMFSLTGCARMGELVLRGENPDAYEATRGEDRTTAESERDAAAAAAAAEAEASKDSEGGNGESDE